MMQIEMPKYVCHKEVWALKIKAVTENRAANKVVLEFTDSSYANMDVDFDWYYSKKPTAGGYYVVYADGYSSFSPAKAFEDGYTLREISK